MKRSARGNKWQEFGNYGREEANLTRPGPLRRHSTRTLEISEGFSETIPANELKNPAGAIDTSLEHGRVTAAEIIGRNLEITDAKKLI